MKKKAETFDCECIDCGHELKSETHCKDLKCDKCGGQMRRKERPGPGQKAKTFNKKSVKLVQDAIIRRFGSYAGLDVVEQDGLFRITNKNPQAEKMHIAAEFSEREDNGEKLTVLSFSSELPVTQFGEPEILLHDAGAADFSRLMTVGAILKNHDPDVIVGVPVRAWIDEQKRGNLTMRWGTTPEALKAKQEALVDKTLRGVSVGYSIKEFVYLKDETETYQGISGPAWVASKWDALEASLTPIPADPSVGLNRSVRVCRQVQVTKTKKEKQDMKKRLKLLRAWKESDEISHDAGVELEVDERTFTELTEGDDPIATPVEVKREVAPVELKPADPPTAEKKPLEVDIGKQIREAIQAETRTEQKRVNDIQAVCKRFKMDDLSSDLIAGGKTVEESQRTVLDEMAKRQKSPIHGTITLVKDGADSFRAAAVDALLMRADQVKVEKPADGADEIRGKSLLRLAEECLMRNGVKVPPNVNDMVALALRSKETITGTSSDFPIILGTAANKSLLAGYEVAAVSYPFWARVGSLNDFKAAQRIKFSDVGNLKEIAEAGTYTRTARAEKKETIQLGTYGRMWCMSRQGVINDDLGAFTNTLFSFGMQARMLPNDLGIAVLNANAALEDTYDLFGTEHANNSANTDYRLDTLAHASAGLEVLINLLAAQKNYLEAGEVATGSRYLNLRGKIWLVAQTDELIARQVINSASDVNSNSNAGVTNPFAGLGIQIVPDQNIMTSSTDYKYFLFADPRMAPVVEIAFLQGNQQPHMEEYDQTDADGRLWKIRLDCGAAAVDYVGAAREVGTT